MNKSVWYSCLALTAVGALGGLGCGGGGGSTGTATPTPAPTATPTPTGNPTAPPTPTPTSTPTPTPTPSPAPGAPNAPTNLGISLSGTSATLTWTDNSSNETGFRIEQNISGNGWTTLQTVTSDATSATLSSLASETTYQFRIVAINASGSSAPSNEVSGTTSGVVQPTYTLTAPYSPKYLSSLSPLLKWNHTNITFSVDTTADGRSAAILESAVQKAFARWSTATNNLVTFTRVSSGADLPITFVSGSDPDLTSGEGQGSASYTANGSGPRQNLVSTVIKIRVGLTEGQIVTIACHEIGHSLGVTGHSPDSGDIMYGGALSTTTPVSQRDANTIASLYLTNDTN